MPNESLQKLVTELDVLIRARYPLVAANTHEENRFRRVMSAVAGLKTHKEKDKGLYLWSRTTGLKQTVGKELKGKEEILIPETHDPISVLEYIAKQQKGLFVLCDYGPYLAPYGQEDPQLVRRLRELAWEIKTRHVTVIFVEQQFPDIPALEKEVKAIELPLPDEHEVTVMLDVQMQKLDGSGIKVEVDEQLREQLVQALLGLTETDIENVLAKAIIAGAGLTAEALPVILDEKKSVIKGTGALSYTHPEPASNLGGYHNLRRILQEAAVTFTPAARAYGVEPMKGLLLVGLPGTAELRSFAQWAHAMGREATGHVVAQEYHPATKEDAVRLQLSAGTPVLHVLRVRGLDGEPVLLERTVYADWISPAVAAIEPECASVTQRLHEETGLVFAYGEHVIDAVAAGAQDAELLGIRRTSPLLRVRRVTTTREGRPVEWSDDRYRSDAVSFSVHNSIDNNALARKTAD